MSDMPGREWMRRGGLGGSIDGGTWVVVLLWLGLLLLVPSHPSGEATAPLPPACMISAWPGPLADLSLALRPDLVTLPSAVSFGAGGPSIDSLQGVPAFRLYRGKPLPAAVDEPPQGCRETAEAVLRRSAAESLVPGAIIAELTGVGGNTIPASMTGWRVVCSPSLCDTRLSAAFMNTFKPPGDMTCFETELWIQFDRGGRPLEIFVEKSGNRAHAQELVRQLWNPANWAGATGQGRVIVRYLAGTGGTDASEDN